jgi:prephenate dehydratase
LFYLDVEGSEADEHVELALNHLREIASYLKVLGSYPRGKTID